VVLLEVEALNTSEVLTYNALQKTKQRPLLNPLIPGCM